MSAAATLGSNDEPQNSAALVAVHYGNYHDQEIWVRSGANIGNWYPLGGEFGLLRSGRPAPPMHPHWEDVLARGPVTLLSAADQESYQAGWAAGRHRLVEQIEGLE